MRLDAPKEPDRFGRYMVYEFRTKPPGTAATNTETAVRSASTGRNAVKRQHKYNGRKKREKTKTVGGRASETLPGVSHFRGSLCFL